MPGDTQPYLRQIDVVKHICRCWDAISTRNSSGKGTYSLPLTVLLTLVVQQIPVERVLVHSKIPAQVGKDAIQGFVLHTICAQLVSLHIHQQAVSKLSVSLLLLVLLLCWARKCTNPQQTSARWQRSPGDCIQGTPSVLSFLCITTSKQSAVIFDACYCCFMSRSH